MVGITNNTNVGMLIIKKPYTLQQKTIQVPRKRVDKKKFLSQISLNNFKVECMLENPMQIYFLQFSFIYVYIKQTRISFLWPLPRKKQNLKFDVMNALLNNSVSWRNKETALSETSSSYELHKSTYITFTDQVYNNHVKYFLSISHYLGLHNYKNQAVHWLELFDFNFDSYLTKLKDHLSKILLIFTIKMQKEKQTIKQKNPPMALMALLSTVSLIRTAYLPIFTMAEIQRCSRFWTVKISVWCGVPGGIQDPLHNAAFKKDDVEQQLHQPIG